jgi:hypothetical protein
MASLISRVGSEWHMLNPTKLKNKMIRDSLKHVITDIPKKTKTPNRFAFSEPPENVEHHHDEDKDGEGDDEDDDEE